MSKETNAVEHTQGKCTVFKEESSGLHSRTTHTQGKCDILPLRGCSAWPSSCPNCGRPMIATASSAKGSEDKELAP